jgi:hypothetical protein
MIFITKDNIFEGKVNFNQRIQVGISMSVKPIADEAQSSKPKGVSFQL